MSFPEQVKPTPDHLILYIETLNCKQVESFSLGEVERLDNNAERLGIFLLFLCPRIF